MSAATESKAPAARPFAGPRTSALSSNALVWSIISIPLTCIALPAFVGIVQGARAVSMARANGAIVPRRAIAAIVVGLLSLALSATGWSFRYVINRNVAARYADATARADRGASAATLAPAAACALIERRLLDGDTPGIVPRFLGAVRCDGALDQTATAATLSNVSVVVDDDPRTMTACFARDTKWFVAKLGTDVTCDPLDAPASDAPAQTP